MGTMLTYRIPRIGICPGLTKRRTVIYLPFVEILPVYPDSLIRKCLHALHNPKTTLLLTLAQM
jgi:hypothetical protein